MKKSNSSLEIFAYALLVIAFDELYDYCETPDLKHGQKS